jgi:type I restriction enzyme, R subunit
MSKHTEIRFEEAIEQELVDSGGFVKGDPKTYDLESALFPEVVISFLQKSQPKKWNTLQQILGEKTSETILHDLTKELAAKGSLHVLRHGFKCFGKNFKLAFFTPNSGMNEEAWKDYNTNMLTITRQVHFSPHHPNLSLDVVLALNG